MRSVGLAAGRCPSVRLLAQRRQELTAGLSVEGLGILRARVGPNQRSMEACSIIACPKFLSWRSAAIDDASNLRTAAARRSMRCSAAGMLWS